ncbi:MAG: DUF992 domain-containing protein [Mariprofundus sp.]|nr:DUF992 domain-containing protein [Mariprofundus sp.]
MRKSLFGLGLALVASALMAAPAFAGHSTAGTKIGVLNCDSIPGSGVNLLIHSTVDLECTFNSTDGSGVEHYVGETGVGFGIDLKWDSKRHLVFSVFAADTKSGSNKMAGKYAGVGAAAAVGLGLGAQVLVGGSDKSVSLQPVIEGSEGIGASAGLTYLYLQAK